MEVEFVGFQEVRMMFRMGFGGCRKCLTNCGGQWEVVVVFLWQTRGRGCERDVVVLFERLWVQTGGCGGVRKVVDANEQSRSKQVVVGVNGMLWCCSTGCGGKREVVDANGRLCVKTGACGGVRKVVGANGRSWWQMGACGHKWELVVVFERLCGGKWEVVVMFERSWVQMGVVGKNGSWWCLRGCGRKREVVVVSRGCGHKREVLELLLETSESGREETQ
jgi:hypothetical protein